MSAASARSTRWIAFTLRWGSYLSALLLLAGLAWVLTAPDVPLQAGPAMPLGVLGPQLAARNPYAVMQLGLLLLLATPLLRVAVAGVAFWVNQERGYTLVSVAVLALILLSVFLVRTG